jgi:outer membrane protein assembly factor BamB/serine/threonine protein kinase
VSAALEPLVPGDPLKVGGYELRARLGSGGMGRVYLGFSAAGRAVAVKVVHPALAGDQEFRARFRREAAAAQAVSGAYTASVVAAGPDDDPPWLATVFVPGPSLAEAVADGGPLPTASVWRLAAGLVEALQALHSRGLVHRDLKPANVLLAVDGPRVIDFGISRALEATSVTATGTTVGTPSFMSPEQAEGGPPAPAGDVFSLGGVLTFAATGAAPFGDGSPADVLYRVVHSAPALDGVPVSLRDLVSGCLAKAPADRPALSQLAAAIAAAAPAAAVSSPTSFWPEALTDLIRAYHDRLSPGSAAGEGPGPTRLDARPAVTGPLASPGSAPTPPGSGQAGSPSPPPPGRRPGVGRRQVVLAGAGVVAAGAGLTAWFLTRGSPPAGKGAGSQTTASTPATARAAPRVPGTRLWSFQTSGGQVHSVTAAPGVVYLANTNNGAAPDAHNVYALHAGTGAQLWRVTNLGELYSLLTLAGGALYFGTDFHYVYALNASDGAMRWRRLTGDRVVCPPAVSGGVVYAGSNDRSLYALGASTGHTLWDFRTGGAVRSGPVVQGSGGAGLVSFGSDDGSVYQLQAASGTQKWRSAVGGFVREPVAVGPGVVYAASDDKHVYALRADDGGLLWRFATSDHPVSPVLAGDLLYVGSADNVLYALHAATGERIWTYPASGDQITWRVAAADGAVYAGSLDGHVYALNAADGTKRWSYATGGPVNSSLQVSGGIVYAGSDDGSLYALRA